MASGLIGTSTLGPNRQSDLSAASGATLTYTCPAAGVRYAVVTIVADAQFTSTTNVQSQDYIKAGILVVQSPQAINQTSARSLTYTVVLTANQVWTGVTQFPAGAATGVGLAYAQLTASVLEVV